MTIQINLSKRNYEFRCKNSKGQRFSVPAHVYYKLPNKAVGLNINNETLSYDR